jgi:hypothetical protein
MKSSSSAGPRNPAFSEFWLSATYTPWFVVMARAPPSARTRSSGPIVELKPVVGAPEPVLGEGLVSVSVLPVTATSSGSSGLPAGGLRALSPNSANLIGLVGIASARAAAPAALRAGRSPWSTRAALRAGPLTVAREEVLADSEVFEPADRFPGGLRLAISVPRLAHFFRALRLGGRGDVAFFFRGR